MSFNTAISGMHAAQSDLDVVGNNISNAGTTGFKGSTINFQDVYAVSNAGTASNNAGSGVSVGNVQQSFAQGNITTTNNPLDLAISGNGFFLINDNGITNYSRDGTFNIDNQGYLVNVNGNQVLTYGADATGAINGALGPLKLSQGNNPPKATTSVSFGANFDSSATVPTVTPFSPTNSNSYNNTTATTVYDSQGGSHTLQSYFVRTAATNAWDVYSYVDGTAVGAANTLTFDGSGNLATPATGKITLPAFTPTPGVNPMNLTVDFTGSTMFGAAFGVNRSSQDGYTSGVLKSLDINSTGIITAHFNNGQTTVQGQIALANFTNVQGLQPIGKNAWAQTAASGTALPGKAGTASLGLIQGSAVEQSNVDLSTELVNLIVAQRNFQANAQVITTESAVQQAVINAH